ncbi:MAG TPA: nucleoside triphosphate pyrophosphohydrolase [Pleomorphomonadaceae bacterium]|nr:nucleoside triphosphate pyrophosphohydrolase [Pleomorphomonadaceae bacterium]
MTDVRRGLDLLLAAAGLDPGAGIQAVSADRLAAIPFDPSLPLLIMAVDPEQDPIVAGTLPGRHVRSGPQAVLAAMYPHGHPIRPLPAGDPSTVDAVDDATLRAGDWLVPALPPDDNLASPHGMAAISARLRAPDGCPWDRRQDHRSLRTYLLEEAYETVDAIERGSPADLAEELGDLYLQVILHAQLAAEAGHFDLTDVYRTLGAKIVRRHPHVFGDLAVTGVEQVVANWETIKSAEREEGGRPPATFAGVARALPALPASREIQERASALGWDWPAVEGVWDKVGEELNELRAAAAADPSMAGERLHELGDVLFALVNLGRWLGIDPEEALRAANRRWVERYAAVEALAERRGLLLADLDASAKDQLWNEVKAG